MVSDKNGMDFHLDEAEAYLDLADGLAATRR